VAATHIWGTHDHPALSGSKPEEAVGHAPALCSRTVAALLNVVTSSSKSREIRRHCRLSQRSVRTRRQPELADDNDPLSPSMNTRVMRSLKVGLVSRTG
jgi:hypothetical protein